VLILTLSAIWVYMEIPKKARLSWIEAWDFSERTFHWREDAWLFFDFACAEARQQRFEVSALGPKQVTFSMNHNGLERCGRVGGSADKS
jgi:hypothetical protein